MSRISFEGSDYLQARAFLQRFSEVGTMNGRALARRSRGALPRRAAAGRYAQRLQQEFPNSDEARLLAGQRLMAELTEQEIAPHADHAPSPGGTPARGA